MKKIAVLVPSLRGGGAERFVINLVNYLDKNKFHINLILANKEGAYISLLPEDIQVKDLSSKKVRYAFLKLIKELNKYKPDIVLSTHFDMNFLFLLTGFFLVNRPKIIIREANTPSRKKFKSDINKKLFYFIYKILLKQAHLIIAQCKDMEEDIIQTFSLKPGIVKSIYNPLSLSIIEKECKEVNPYDQSRLNIVSVGRLSYQKNHQMLIEAFNLVKEKKPEVHLTIVGKGKLENQLRERIGDLGLNDSVTLAGYKDNPYPYLYYADLFVLSSRYEGFPNVLLEALACGTKVVSVDCASGPREILGDNNYGILVEEGNAYEMAKGIIRALDNENLTKNRATDFDIDIIIKQWEELLDSI